jgi:hypothetical protein
MGKGDGEDSSTPVALVNQLALMPAYEVLLYEPNWDQVPLCPAGDHEDAPTLSQNGRHMQSLSNHVRGGRLA